MSFYFLLVYLAGISGICFISHMSFLLVYDILALKLPKDHLPKPF